MLNKVYLYTKAWKVEMFIFTYINYIQKTEHSSTKQTATYV